MSFKMIHMNINCLDLEKSLQFYKNQLGLHEVRRKKADDGSFELVYLADDTDSFQLELTWLRDRKEPYDLSDNEIHLALETTDYDQSLAKHQEAGVVCFNNQDMGIYFIEDPDGYWIEIVPA